jgi:hypothetical protein
LYPSAGDMPPVMIFRAPVFPFYFVILGLAAFSFSPALVMWTGIAGAMGWLAAYFRAASGLEGVRNWNEIPANPTAEQVMAVVLDPRFGGLGGRIQEAVVLAAVAFLIAVVRHPRHGGSHCSIRWHPGVGAYLGPTKQLRP